MATKNQQNELDKIERFFLTSLFGSENIPEPSYIALKLMNINPNQIIHKFENTILPLMKDDGSVDGTILKRIILMSKFKDIESFIKIPDQDFFLSEMCFEIVRIFLPGVEI